MLVVLQAPPTVHPQTRSNQVASVVMKIRDDYLCPIRVTIINNETPASTLISAVCPDSLKISGASPVPSKLISLHHRAGNQEWSIYARVCTS